MSLPPRVHCAIALSAIALIAISFPAQAAVIPVHDPTVVGNGNVPSDGFNLSLDTSTDFEWLDLSLSTSMSYNSMIAQLGPGGLFDGFQHASNAEVVQLWTNLGLPSGSFPAISSVNDGGVLADSAIDLLTQTGINATFRVTQGTSTNVVAPGNHRVLTIRHNLPPTISTTLGNGGLGDTVAGGEIGHWLYRDRSPVPEPSPLAIMGMAIAAAVAIRSRRG
jgi:hypothetical protein